MVDMNTIPQIRTITERITDLFEQIGELKSYIDQLTNGTMSKLGSPQSNRIAITEYKYKIAELEKEINQIWNSK